MKPPFEWDHLSDQPHVISNKTFKNSLKKQGIPHYVKSFFVALITLPIVLFAMLFFRAKKTTLTGADFLGLCVNQDKLPELAPELVAQLGVKKILVRIPLWDCDNIDKYKAFCQSLGDVDIVFCLLQDREHVTNHAMLTKHIDIVFTALRGISCEFQVGNATNRLKWGCISVEESLQFFGVVKAYRDAHFKEIKLIGSSVIDFEPISTVRSVFHLYNAKADAMAALLYVDRRGSPESTQGWIFDFKHKIRFVYTAMCLSPKIHNKLYITEINWPLKDKSGYAPAKGDCTVSEDDAAMYLVRSYLIAWATGQVDTVFWHQLIAPGYGLVDHREDVRFMPAFYAFKTLNQFLVSAQLTRYTVQNHIHSCLFIDKPNGIKICIAWSDDPATLAVFNQKWKASTLYNLYGEVLLPDNITHIASQPLYEVVHADTLHDSSC